MARRDSSLAALLRWRALHTIVAATAILTCAGCTVAAATLAIGVSGGVVGAAGLGASAYGVYMTRQQVRAAVWPRLEIGFDFSGDRVRVGLSNRGVGPAEVKRVRVRVDRVPSDDWVDAAGRLLHRKLLSAGSIKFSISSIEQKVLSPGLEIQALELKDAKDARQFVAQASRLAIEVCYCSTLGDCWEVTAPSALGDTLTHAVSDCAADPKPFQSFGTKSMNELVDALARMPLPVDAGVQDGGAKGD